MNANIIRLSEYQKSQNEEKRFIDEYRQLRDLMVSIFGPLEHVPTEPEAVAGSESLEEIG